MDRWVKSLFKTKLAGQLCGLIFSKASGWVPIKPLRESKAWLVYVHPKPCYPIHIVLVPKRKVRDWLSLPAEDQELFSEFVDLTQSMIRDFCLQEAGYRLIVNGGANQAFPHLHVHLIAGDAF